MTIARDASTITGDGGPTPRRTRDVVVRGVAGALAAALVVALVTTLVQAWPALGKAATGERRARMERSPQWRGKGFVNPQPLVNDNVGAVTAMFAASAHATPHDPPPVEVVDPARFVTPPSTGLRITWFGHASTLVEIDSVRVLTDPMWSERAGPLTWIGPVRYAPAAIALADLPPIDAVVVSHDHFDHLDMRTIQALKDRAAKFIVPLGVGAHLAYWGIPDDKIIEVDWWDRVQLGAIEVVCTPARHASGRQVFDVDATLWAGYALVGPQHRVYFSGDTGLFPAMQDIGAKYGPFDVTMIETGQYHRAWPDWHIGPERAVAAHQIVRGKMMLPIHWALLTLAAHGWTEPVERVLAEARARGVSVATPKLGQSVEPDAAVVVDRWWPEVPWQTAAQAPVARPGEGSSPGEEAPL